jgi:hypothetical protein
MSAVRREAAAAVNVVVAAFDQEGGDQRNRWACACVRNRMSVSLRGGGGELGNLKT